MTKLVGVRMEGTKQLRAALKQAGDDLSDMKEAHAKIARMVAQVASGRAPVGPTGRLAASVRGSGTKTASVVRAGGAKVPYAGPVHWGWPRRYAYGERIGPIVPQPFLADAAAYTEPKWIGMYLDDLQAIMDKIGETADGSGE